MGNIGDPFSTATPTVGSSGPNYATDVNAILDEVKSRLSTKIPFSSLSLGSSLDLNGQAILNAAYLQLSNTGSSPGASPVNRVTAFGGNLYWVGPSGPVQITVGSLLNSAAVGGIIGDYGGANPAKVSYVAANTRYEFFHDFSTSTWANLRARGVDISAGATGTIMAQLRYGGAGTITFTLPPTLPAANALLGISSTGAITSNPTIDTDVTLGGVTVIKHGDRTQHVNFGDIMSTSGGGFTVGAASDAVFWQLANNSTGYIACGQMEDGIRVKSVEISRVNGGAAPTVSIITTEHSTNVATTRAHTASTPGGTRLLLTLNTPLVISSTANQMRIKMVTGAGGSDNCTIYSIRYTYDRV